MKKVTTLLINEFATSIFKNNEAKSKSKLDLDVVPIKSNLERDNFKTLETPPDLIDNTDVINVDLLADYLDVFLEDAVYDKINLIYTEETVSVHILELEDRTKKKDLDEIVKKELENLNLPYEYMSDYILCRRPVKEEKDFVSILYVDKEVVTHYAVALRAINKKIVSVAYAPMALNTLRIKYEKALKVFSDSRYTLQLYFTSTMSYATIFEYDVPVFSVDAKNQKIDKTNFDQHINELLHKTSNFFKYKFRDGEELQKIVIYNFAFDVTKKDMDDFAKKSRFDNIVIFDIHKYLDLEDKNFNNINVLTYACTQ